MYSPTLISTSVTGDGSVGRIPNSIYCEIRVIQEVGVAPLTTATDFPLVSMIGVFLIS